MIVGCPNCLSNFNRTNASKIFCTSQCARESARKTRPLQYKAHRIVEKAIKAKKILKKNLCENCSVISAVHAHHDDYTKPLKVKWLCRKCHKLEHRNIVRPEHSNLDVRSPIALLRVLLDGWG